MKASEKAILTDITKCIGCNSCVTACKLANELPPDKPRQWQKNDGLSARNWTSVLSNGKYYVRKQCRHCEHPACEAACPVGALHRTETGAVVYDSGKCLGCRYCMMACPYGIPRYDWDSTVPYIRKCILCAENIKNGKLQQPACTKACPTGATIYGDREELLLEARRRIAAQPDLYHPTIYGEKEAGGTNVMYITAKDCPLDFLIYYSNRLEKGKHLLGEPGFDDSYADLTSVAMGSVPYAFLGMGAVMTSIYWITKRRKSVENEIKDAEDGKNQ
jgi:formate dehydrogenase iron-sulfur subunit